MRNIAVLGSTGSVGCNALEVIAADPENYRAAALAAGRNIGLLEKQIRSFRPYCAAVLEQDAAKELKGRLGPGLSTEILWGREGYARIAALDGVHTVVSAITGEAGLEPTYVAVESGKDVALANKETLVLAGGLVMAKAAEKGGRILPVDSEHSAVFQSIQGHPRDDLKRIILTASGGPFLDRSLDQMAEVTPEEALNHPKWEMGAKITVDSATLMNKGLEVIEAHWLFDIDMDRISVVIHPQSIIHSMAEYKDGSIIAQLGVPHMITPISYALSYPRHRETKLPSLSLEDLGPLTLERPDLKRFRCLALALEAGAEGGSMPTVLNAADEVAVGAFLDKRLGFLGIPELVEQVMNAHQPFPIESLEHVREADDWARKKAEEFLRAGGGRNEAE
ncbi:MAG: 1-deoxy-D-xylulose-5-phosphate reductoisomerase [Desulfobacteraceae bacterium]